MKKTVFIVGLGLIGGSLARALTTKTEHRVIGMDRNPEVEQKALAAGAVHEIGTEEDIGRADLLFVCLYPQAVLDFVARNAARIPKRCIVTDVCGIKGTLCGELAALAREWGFVFLGSHPMAGKEKAGFDASDDDLFLGASYLIVPCGAPAWAVDAVSDLALSLGCAGVRLTTPEEHDAMIAFTSQLPHALACAYVLSPRCPGHAGFSAGSYRDVSRVARINETLWSELFLDNRGPLLEEIHTLIANLDRISAALEARDRDALAALLRQGREIKEALGE